MQLQHFSIFEQFPNLLHGISTRHTERFQEYDVLAEQVHDNKYAWVNSPQSDAIPHVDALLTRQPGVRLRIGTADCVPIIIYDPITHSGGVVHAGFQGTVREIVSETLKQFDVSNVYIGIGPAIGPCCYDEIDIQIENYEQALEVGVVADRIEIMRICTKCNSDTYYSYRAGDRVNFGTYFELQ